VLELIDTVLFSLRPVGGRLGAAVAGEPAYRRAVVVEL
jgi:hypothetical protein